MIAGVPAWRRALLPVLYLTAAAAVAWAALAARGRLDALSVGWSVRLLPIVVILALQIVLLTAGWGLLLRAVQPAIRLSPWLVGRSFLLGWLIRYLPGVPASAAGRFVVCREAGYTPASIAAALFYETLLQLGAGLLVPAAALGFWLGRTGAWLAPVAALAVCALTALAVSPPIVLRLARRLRRAGMTSAGAFRPVPLAALVAPFLATALAALLAALAFHEIAVMITSLDDRAIGRTVFAYGLAGFLGFIVPLLPSGVGVREAALVALLGPAIGHGEALALAVAARALPVLFDATLAAGLALVMGAGAARARLAPALRRLGRKSGRTRAQPSTMSAPGGSP